MREFWHLLLYYLNVIDLQELNKRIGIGHIGKSTVLMLTLVGFIYIMFFAIAVAGMYAIKFLFEQ